MRKLLLASAATLAATAAGAAEVRVGSAGGVTGPIAELIVDVMSGRELAASVVNAQGGLYGGDEMVLVVGDSACDPKAAVDTATKLVNIDRVVAIIGASCSGAMNAMVQSVTIPAGVVAISDSATNPAISGLDDNDTVFRVAPSDAYQGIALAQHVLNSGIKTVVVTYANDDYNAGLGVEFIKAYEAAGGTVAATQVHEPNKASYRAEVATLAGAKAEALVLFAYYGGSGIAIMRNALEIGAYDTFFGADGMLHEEVINQIGAENLTKAAFTTPGADDSSAGWAAYMALAGDIKATAPYVANAFDATFLMALALEKAGSPDRDKIAAALREVASAPGEVILPGEWEKAKALIAQGVDINYEGATGSLDFDAAGDVPGVYSLNTVGPDGKFTSVLLK